MERRYTNECVCADVYWMKMYNIDGNAIEMNGSCARSSLVHKHYTRHSTIHIYTIASYWIFPFSWDNLSIHTKYEILRWTTSCTSIVLFEADSVSYVEQSLLCVMEIILGVLFNDELGIVHLEFLTHSLLTVSKMFYLLFVPHFGKLENNFHSLWIHIFFVGGFSSAMDR